MELGRKLADWFSGVVGIRPLGRRAKTGARSIPVAADRSHSFGGFFVAVAVVVSLGAGFLAGQWTEAWTGGNHRNRASSTDLRRQVGRGQTPGPLGRAGSMTADEELKRLTSQAYRVFAYRGSERSKASRLANWLVSQGVPTARLRRMVMRKKGKDSSPVWAVVCYVPDAEDRRVFTQLRSLAAPRFEPRLERLLANLNPIPDPVGG